MTDRPQEKFWIRLHRRKVVQWGIAYVAGAWGLLQGLSYLLATFQWPQVIQPLATLALIAGLPIAVVVAWYHGDRGEQKVSAAELTIITLLFLVGGAIFWHYARNRPAEPVPGMTSQPGTAGAAAAAVVNDAPANAIAVLPFVNMSGDPANEYFSDGISEEILNVLARSPGLQVAARTSSFAFKGKSEDVPAIARDLRVRMVLEGSVRKQGDKVRITAQLVDAKTGFHVWSETYDRKLTDIFAIQDQIASAIGERMQVSLASPGTATGATGDAALASATRNPVAHDHYLRGLALWQQRREAELWQSIEEFERAIDADPKYAAAYGGLALAYAVIADFSARITYDEASDRATDAAELALVLDPSLPEAYAALGSVATSRHRRTVDKALYERAIALRPSFATAYQWLGTATLAGGNPEASIPPLERASTLDPRSLVVADNYAFALIALGRYEDAILVCGRLLEFAPDFIPCLKDVGVSEIMLGRFDAARGPLTRAAELGNPSALPQIRELIDALQGRADKRTFAQRLSATTMRSYLEQGSGNLFDAEYIPMLLVALGAPHAALGYVERQAGEPYGIVDWGMAAVALDPIRCDPRFAAAQHKLSINDVRAARICAARSAAR